MSWRVAGSCQIVGDSYKAPESDSLDDGVERYPAISVAFLNFSPVTADHYGVTRIGCASFRWIAPDTNPNLPAVVFFALIPYVFLPKMLRR
jgi:hypothetical protein